MSYRNKIIKALLIDLNHVFLCNKITYSLTVFDGRDL